MKKILITGVAGLIGSHLLDEIMEFTSDHVIGLDTLQTSNLKHIEHHLKNPRFEFIQQDVMNIDTLSEKKWCDIDTIVQLAAAKKSGEDGSWYETFRINFSGTEKVLNFAKRLSATFIFASTSDVYGVSKDLPFHEEQNLVLGPSPVKRWSYAVSKLAAEHLCFAYYKEFGVPIIILRYFGAFSHRSHQSWRGGHIPIFIDAILNHKSVIVHGTGRQTRSMTHATDIASGTLMAIYCKNAIGKIVNLGSTEEVSILETIKLIERISGKSAQIQFIPHKELFGNYEEIQRRIPNLSLAKKLLSYVPKISFYVGLQKTISLWQ